MCAVCIHGLKVGMETSQTFTEEKWQDTHGSGSGRCGIEDAGTVGIGAEEKKTNIDPPVLDPRLEDSFSSTADGNAAKRNVMSQTSSRGFPDGATFRPRSIFCSCVRIGEREREKTRRKRRKRKCEWKDKEKVTRGREREKKREREKENKFKEKPRKNWHA